MAFIVTRALASDAPSLAALHRQAFPRGWSAADFEASCADANRAVLKATDGAALLGLAVLQFAAGEAEILSIAVAKEARRRGIATCLLENAIGICMEKLISCIYLEVAESNNAALSLYGKAGFHMLARRENYYQAASPAPEAALVMRRGIGNGVARFDRQRDGIR